MYRYPSPLLQKVKRHLRAGGVIAYPTESCYGLGCNPWNYSAINKILKLKGRNKTKGLIVIAGRMAQLSGLIQSLSPTEKEEISAYWPGPYSLILPITRQVPRNLIGKHAQIAVRVSRHPLVTQLCNYLNLPLVSTSANQAGHRSVRSYRECQRQFGAKVLVLPGNTSFARRPSTIIDWSTHRILR